jgi:hypothetical protein
LSQIFAAWEFVANRAALLKSSALRYAYAADSDLIRNIKVKSTEFSTRVVENCGDHH